MEGGRNVSVCLVTVTLLKIRRWTTELHSTLWWLLVPFYDSGNFTCSASFVTAVKIICLLFSGEVTFVIQLEQQPIALQLQNVVILLRPAFPSFKEHESQIISSTCFCKTKTQPLTRQEVRLAVSHLVYNTLAAILIPWSVPFLNV